jgi:hypothetical protein
MDERHRQASVTSYFHPMPFPALDIRRPQLPEALVKKSARLKVRECDQESPGRYVAYVDETDRSRDVTLECDAAGVLRTARCDCGRGEERICEHIAALILHIASEGRSGARQVRKPGPKARPDPVAALLDSIPPENLRDWLAGQLAKHRELQLAFVHHFDTRKAPPTPEAVLALTEEARRAVLKNRRKAESSEAKRLVDAWKVVHEPLVRAYLDDLTSPEAYAVFDAVVHAVDQIAGTIETGSTRLSGYLKELIRRPHAPLAVLATDEAWHRALDVYGRSFRREARYMAVLYFNGLLEHAESSEGPRKADLVERLVTAYRDGLKDSNLVTGRTLAALLALTMATGRFDPHAGVFQTITWENEYNLALIDALARTGRLERAAAEAHRQLERNVDERFDFGYLLALRRIYRAMGDTVRILPVVQRLLPADFDLQDYTLLLAQQADAQQRSRFRDHTFALALRRAGAGSDNARRFCRELLVQEGRHRELIDLLREIPCAYTDILAAFDIMHQADPEALLHALLLRSDACLIPGPADKSPETAEKVRQTYAKALAHYGAERLRQALRDRQLQPPGYLRNRFRAYAADQLGETR